jgi:hypothetical protein
MDSVVVDFSDDGQIRLENEAWRPPSLQEQRAVIYAAREEIARLTELVDMLDALNQRSHGGR